MSILRFFRKQSRITEGEREICGTVAKILELNAKLLRLYENGCDFERKDIKERIENLEKLVAGLKEVFKIK